MNPKRFQRVGRDAFANSHGKPVLRQIGPGVFEDSKGKVVRLVNPRTGDPLPLLRRQPEKEAS